jgi:hypothetical protein
MKSLIKYGLAAAMVLAIAIPATPALAKRSFDVCVNPATDVATEDGFVPGGFLTVAGDIFPEGTIPPGGVAPSCSISDSLAIGTFYANVGVEAGLPAAPDVLAFVTWHFDLSPKGTFVTVGPIPFPPNHVPPGPATFPQTLAGASGPFPSRGKATVTPLSPDGFQFRITLPRFEE